MAKPKSKNKELKVFAGVGGTLFILFLVVTILANSVFYTLVCTLLGGQRARFAEGEEPVFVADYATKAETLAAANEINQRVVEESIILLKNNDGALPIDTSANPKVSVFGQNSINLALGGSGSGAATNSADAVTDLYEALEHAGFEVNPTLKSFYENSGYKRSQNSSDLDSGDSVMLEVGEAPQSAYTDAVKNSYREYNDAAIVVLTRIGGEGFDLPRTMTNMDGARADDDHYLQLDANEAAMLEAVTNAGFEKVIVLINSAAAMELGFLEEDCGYVDIKGYQIDPSKIDAALWIGFPGDTGTEAVGKVLSGEVNPSGRTVDTYVTDLKKDPSWFNFGDNRVANGDRYTMNGDNTLYYFVSYEEGVYVGYRYYETRGYTDGEQWYQSNVVYPFGYGLSYTTFSWELEDASSIENVTIDGTAEYSVQVKVTNTGDCAGKDVVELYATAPYISGEIEKPHKVLVGFAKTSLLEPGDSEIVELTFDPYYLSSYDYTDLNGNGFAGYELDGGTYTLHISTNAHESRIAVSFAVAEDGILYENDPVTGYEVVNRYSDQDDEYLNSDLALSDVSVNGEMRKGLSRLDWEGTWPSTPSGEDYAMSQELLAALQDTEHNNPNDYYSEEYPYEGEPVTISFRDLLTGENGEKNGYVEYDDPRWETFLDQLTFDEMSDMYDNGAFRTAGIASVGKPLTNDTDGPAGFTNFMLMDGTYWGNCHYCAEVNMSATWNTELIEELGTMVGNEGLIGAAGQGNGLPYSGWYAPGINIHRSAFGGRNFEYFSEDGFLAGMMAAAEIRGCKSKGVYCYMKHFALNEQETHRSITGNITWVTEQAMREIFLKPFEMAVKEGGATAAMSSFNRIGTRWTGGDYRLLTEILRNEWGFKGTVICDFNTIPAYMNSRQMAYAGGDLNLATQPVSWCDTSDTSDVIVLRQATKNILYTVVNSNAMTAEIIGYDPPLWQIGLYIADAALLVGLVIWGVFLGIKMKKNKAQQ